MPFEISRADVWVGEVEDRSGALHERLEVLHQAGVDLEVALVRPAAPLSGTGVLFVTPIVGVEQTRAARQCELRQTESIHAVRIFGPDRPGLIAEIARIIAAMGINLNGLSSAALVGHSVHYFRFECASDADRAVKILKAKLV